MDRSITLGSNDLLDLSDKGVISSLRSVRRTQLNGLYYYDSVCFQRHEAVIREYFSPIQVHQRAVDGLEVDCRKVGGILIGVHIRHGDYEHFADGLMYYSVGEYVQLMHLVTELFPGREITFLIASNVSVPNEAFEGFRHRMAPGQPVVDLYALARCDYIIGPPSTFTEWASFYGQVPRYVHYKNSFVRSGQHWPGVSLKDFKIHRDGFARCNPTHPATLRS